MILNLRKVKLKCSIKEVKITITGEEESIVFFELKGKEYGCWYPEIDQDVSSPFILVKNDIDYDYPHIGL